MRFFLLCLALFATPAFAEFRFPLPRVYTVTGVASDDTLNVRSYPDVSSPVTGTLLPDQTVEVLNFSKDHVWAQVSLGKHSGWVSTRYLRETPKTIALGEDIPYGIPGQLVCFGTEPFWEAEIMTGESFTFNAADGSPAQKHVMQGVAAPRNRGPNTYGFFSPPFSGLLRRESCDNVQSGGIYGWSLDVMKFEGAEAYMVSGCCTARQP